MKTNHNPTNPGEVGYLSRRHFLETATFAAVAMWLAPRRLLADPGSPVIDFHKAAATAKITITKLRGNISVLEGSGGNIAVLTGRDGKLLVDAGISESRRQISEALVSLGPEPITHLVNSHWHFDHTDGNAWVHSEGAEITAHENTRKHLSTTTRMEGWKFTFPPAPPGALPTTVFSDEHKLAVNDTTLNLKHYPPAHTDSDISIEFADADILHVADTWINGHYPFIDYSTGGGIDGAIRAAQLNVNRVTDRTIVIPGHGAIGNKAGLIEYRDMLVAVREKVATLKKQGRSLDETIAAAPTAAYDAKWGTWVVNNKAFISLVYQGV